MKKYNAKGDEVLSIDRQSGDTNERRKAIKALINKYSVKGDEVLSSNRQSEAK